MFLNSSLNRTRFYLIPFSILVIGLFSACGGGGGDGSEDELDAAVDGDVELSDGEVSDAKSSGDTSTNGNKETGIDSGPTTGDSGRDVVVPGRSDCGNGELDDGEACDDGNDQDGDGCNASCEIEACYSCPEVAAACEECGNGIVESSEECDDGNCEDGDGCDTSCDIEGDWVCPVDGQPCELCGNGVIEPNERCDDGNADGGDGCAQDCREVEPYFTCPEEGEPCIECGDGEVDGDEVCDDGAQCEDGTDCTDDPSECDGIGDETCAPRSGDGCVYNCTNVEPGWVCPSDGGSCSLCGDGELNEATEECDDGNFQSDDGCSASCELEDGATCMIAGILCSVCGNGYLEYTTYLGDNDTPDDPSDDFADQEECDDGNQNDDDGCSSDCELEPGWDCPVVGMECGICGDGIVQEIEVCDDGRVCTGTTSEILDGTDCTDDDTDCLADGGICASASDDGCSADCVSIDPHYICPEEGGACVECGDGVVDDDLEECDDGDVLSGDGCNRLCQIETNLDWNCVTAGKPCELCGNGINEFNEACDDGNTEGGDGCAADCQSIDDNYNCNFDGYPCTLCGDGVIDVGEECDEGHLLNPAYETDGCDDQCLVVFPWVCPAGGTPCELCGDGTVDTFESCDDNNIANRDGCDSSCQVELGYDCSSGECIAAACGDGFLAGDEECDDGNLKSGDGCSFVCDVEKGFSCAGGAGCHRTVCGDGIVEGEEQCDDGSICTDGTEDGNSCTNDATACETGGGSCGPASLDGCSDLCVIELGMQCPLAGQPCIPALCGNGLVEGAEQCDDGSICTGGDEDSNSCTDDATDCVDGGGSCGPDDEDGCDTQCQLEEGYHCPVPGEACEPTVCGDGMVQGLEECDDGSLTCSGGDHDSEDCTDPTARDNCVNAGGTCDPETPSDADGCAADCTVETFYRCEGEPSACRPIIQFVALRRFRVANVSPAALNYNPDRRSFGGHKAQESQESIELCMDGTVINRGDTTASANGTIWLPDGVTSEPLYVECSVNPDADPCYTVPLRPEQMVAFSGTIVGAAFDPVTGHFLYLHVHGGNVSLTELPRDVSLDADVTEFQVELTGLSTKPTGLTVGEDGDLYIVDSTDEAVYRFPRRRVGEEQMPFWPDCENTIMDEDGNCTSFESAPADGWSAPSVEDDPLGAIFTVPGERLLGVFNEYDGAVSYDGMDAETGGTITSSEYFRFYNHDSTDNPPLYGESGLPGLLFLLGNTGRSYTQEAQAAETAPDGGGFIICPSTSSEPCQIFARVCQSDADCPPGTVCNLDGVSTVGVPYCHAPGDARDDRFRVDRDIVGESNPQTLDVVANDSLSESACLDPTLRIVSLCDDGVDQQYELDNPGTCDATVPQGTIALDEENHIVTYDAPDDGSCGFIDSFTYTANLGGEVYDTATVRVVVACVCGDGIVDGNEQCDDGAYNGDPGEMIDIGDDGNPENDMFARCSNECYLNILCGDGHIAMPEECDDLNTASGDGCSAVCTLESVCGDGSVEGVEVCDDGSQCENDLDCTDDPSVCDGIGDSSCEPRGGDGCNANCTEPYCGDGSLDLDNPREEGAEQCDDGNLRDGDGCSKLCFIEASCGNGTIELGEDCDDGGTVGGDGCSAQCTLENVCGNSIVEGAEVCDGSEYGSCPIIDATQIQCINEEDSAPNICLCENYCGDDSIGGAEECDDGMDGSDNCRSAASESGDPCTEIRCGDGIVDSDEQCDDGNTDPTDDCTNSCLLVTECGDGDKEGLEECDDGNNVSGDGCSSACKLETATCGDDILHYTEQCDDGNTDNGDGCDENCMLEGGVCGDGEIDLGEECDDGNNVSGDGCSGLCMIEFCGNGDIDEDEGEDCDDGRECTDGTDCTDDASVCDGIDDESCEPRSGDGCSATCRIEIF